MRDADDDDWGDSNPPLGVVPGTDCDYDNPFAFPGAAELESPVACMEDADDDGFGNDTPDAGVTPGSDCDDADPVVVSCGVWCDDLDDDGFGDPDACVMVGVQPPGTVGNNLDCDDDNDNAFPGAAQIEDPQACMEDEDDDGWGDDAPPAGVTPGTDCNETAEFAFPGAAQIEGAGVCTGQSQPRIGPRSSVNVTAAPDLRLSGAAAHKPPRVLPAPREIAHSDPLYATGDLFRRVEVGVQVVLDGEEGPSRTRYLARHFGSQVQSSGIVLRGELRDDRVPANGDPREVTWAIPEAEGHPIRWWVEYQRVGHHMGRNPKAAKLDGAIRLAEGTLPAA